MPDTELAEELLQIEEADAWFEYLESTRGQGETRYSRARAVGLGAPHPAVACRPGTPCPAAARGGLSAAGRCSLGRCARAADSLEVRHMANAFHTLRSARRSAPAGLGPRALTRGDTILVLVQVSTTQGRRAGTDTGGDSPGGDRAPAEPAAATTEHRRARRPPRQPPARSAAAAREAGAAGRSRARPQASRREVRRRARGHRRATEASKRTEKKDGERQSRRGSQRSGGKDRRRPPQRRAPLPAAKRELLITVDVGEQRVALLEDDKVAEVYLERPERRSIAGNIYLGTVDNVLPGMEAAFVEIGLEKNGFLYVDEIIVPELEGTRHGKKITDLIQRGQEILVQAVKDPMKTKGARLTTEISLPGRFLVYVPNGEGPRRLAPARGRRAQRLKDILKEIAPADGRRDRAHGGRGRVGRGRRARPRLPAATLEDDPVPREGRRGAGARLPGGRAPAPRSSATSSRATSSRPYVDSDRTLQADRRLPEEDLAAHGRARPPRQGARSRSSSASASRRRSRSTLDRRVDLPVRRLPDLRLRRGVHGHRRQHGPLRRLPLEELDAAARGHGLKNNLEAVKEVVRQLRLRDIGGIIVIDFIDMANPKNRQAVEETLRTELERDRTKTFVVEISPLGLVEMTRQNVTDGPREVMTRRCPTCARRRHRRLRRDRRARGRAQASRARAAGLGARIQAYKVACPPAGAALLAGRRRGAARARSRRRRGGGSSSSPATGHATSTTSRCSPRAAATTWRLRPRLEEGTELELKLVEIDLHDGTRGGRQARGPRHRRRRRGEARRQEGEGRVGRVLEGQAFATLVSGAAPAAPITFESEAEKPTRAPARRKTGDRQPEAAVEPAVDAEAPSRRGGDRGRGRRAEAEAEACRGGRASRRRPQAHAPRLPRRQAAQEARRGDAPTRPSGRGRTEAEPAATGGGRTPEPAVERTRPSRDAARADATPKIHVPDRRRREARHGTAGRGGTPAGRRSRAARGGDPRRGRAADGERTATPRRPKKRTRRGTRGGRNRKRKTTDGERRRGRPPLPRTRDGGDSTPVDETARPGSSR